MYGDTNAHHNWDHNKLSGDHTIARATGGTHTDRLMHLTCNKERGDGTRDHLRPALGGDPTAPADDRAAWCRLDWWGAQNYSAPPPKRDSAAVSL